ncbi:hypothetical protein GDO81_000588 [Engystomops pustulosus]|uniref:Uncharacterized protein n=1 Tax=Engystomops pustulosus TaxID=76066 RepID=A0AAV7D5F7_ENGPU|nr:hypothetical protein GDO81_000588 [Engystomops pustulosus]
MSTRVAVALSSVSSRRSGVDILWDVSASPDGVVRPSRVCPVLLGEDCIPPVEVRTKRVIAAAGRFVCGPICRRPPRGMVTPHALRMLTLTQRSHQDPQLISCWRFRSEEPGTPSLASAHVMFRSRPECLLRPWFIHA